MLWNNGRCVMEICAAPGCKTWVRSLAGKGHLPTSLLAAVRRGKEGRDSWGQRFPSRLRWLPPERSPQYGELTFWGASTPGSVPHPCSVSIALWGTAAPSPAAPHAVGLSLALLGTGAQ